VKKSVVVSNFVLIYSYYSGGNMKKIAEFITFLSLLIILSGCLISSPYIAPPNGGAMVVPKEPLWITGTAEDGRRDLGFNDEYSPLTQTEHFKVDNAGYFLMFKNGEMSASYFYGLNVTKAYTKTVYTKAILDNPTDLHKPIIYTHSLVSG
jgi:hypothetical protein